MAITRAQQYQQLVNPPMKGNKRPGYRGDDAYGGGTTAGGSRSDSPGDRGDGPASRDFGGPGRDVGMGMGGKKRSMGRNPMVSFTEDPVTTAQKARELIALGNKKIGFGNKINFPDFFPTIKAGLNLIKVPQGTFMDQARRDFGRALGPQTVDMSGEDAGQDIPYWAQLGFSSEEEYLASLRAQAPSTEEQETEEEPFQLSRRFRAEGGIMNADVVGGEFDFESARQMYGLGKLVKKVTKTVKKIAKSPVGKAAILAATYKLGGGKFFGGEGFKFSNLPGLGFLKPASTSIGAQAAAVGLSPREFMMGIGGKTATSGGIFSSIPGGALTAGIVGTSAVAGLLTPEEETEAEDLARGEGIDIEAARNAILAARQDDFRARRFRAEGGSMKEPVAKKTMPLLDLDGKEMDLRAEGGFVPIGRMEKADDVPARLSKNEFVFTADAVRNAGDGNVDKGAEVMYNMMKNLEAGGEVSKESQGLEGARRMFQTSKRLEEVL